MPGSHPTAPKSSAQASRCNHLGQRTFSWGRLGDKEHEGLQAWHSGCPFSLHSRIAHAIRVSLTPGSGDAITVDAWIDNTVNNPATVDVPVTPPTNTWVNVMVFTR